MGWAAARGRDDAFWSQAPGAELTAPETPDQDVGTADIPIDALDLRVGTAIAYVFDFGDDWQVRLEVTDRVAGEPGGGYPRVLDAARRRRSTD